jgi:hypothetical protein
MRQQGPPRRTSCAKNVYVLIGENEYHILELMEVEMISWTIYVIMDYQCMGI